MVALWTGGGVLLLAVLAEWLHARRCRRLAVLAFGPTAAPRYWVRLVPLVRPMALAAMAWGLVTLLLVAPQTDAPRSLAAKDLRHVVLVFDVSPSMKLVDAGPAHDQTRAARAADVVRSIINRIATEQIRFSLVAVYSGAKRVVIDTSDLNIIYNILNDLPMSQAFDIGKTMLFDGIKEAAALSADWRPDSATVIIVSDGDTVPDTGMPALPESVAKVMVIGVGDPRVGKFIDGHQSAQDSATLQQIAVRLNGLYHDGNERHLSTEMLLALSKVLPLRRDADAGRRELALACVGIGAVLTAGMPIALAYRGSRWKAGRMPG